MLLPDTQHTGHRAPQDGGVFVFLYCSQLDHRLGLAASIPAYRNEEVGIPSMIHCYCPQTGCSPFSPTASLSAPH